MLVCVWWFAEFILKKLIFGQIMVCRNNKLNHGSKAIPRLCKYSNMLFCKDSNMLFCKDQVYAKTQIYKPWFLESQRKTKHTLKQNRQLKSITFLK